MPTERDGLAPDGTTDKRRLRGARTRGAVLRRAVDMASLDGLGGISFGRLAADVGLSKAGVQTLFPTKEALQLATIARARELFVEAVVRPAWKAAPGLARLRALLEHWIVYAETPLFAGGCFRVATSAEYDGRRGPVHDALFRDHQEWRDLIASELRAAASSGELVGVDADLVAIQVDALLCATNTALRAGDVNATAALRRIVDGLLTSPT